MYIYLYLIMVTYLAGFLAGRDYQHNLEREERKFVAICYDIGME